MKLLFFFNTMPAIRLFLSLSLFPFAQYVCELLMEMAQAKIVGDWIQKYGVFVIHRCYGAQMERRNRKRNKKSTPATADGATVTAASSTLGEISEWEYLTKTNSQKWIKFDVHKMKHTCMPNIHCDWYVVAFKVKGPTRLRNDIIWPGPGVSWYSTKLPLNGNRQAKERVREWHCV